MLTLFSLFINNHRETQFIMGFFEAPIRRLDGLSEDSEGWRLPV